MDAVPWLCGYNWWNFADFAWAKSSSPPLFNNKGLVTFDRQKKDSFQYLKWRWTGAPSWPTAETRLRLAPGSVPKVEPPREAVEADPSKNPAR
jgi:beta-galactosidase